MKYLPTINYGKSTISYYICLKVQYYYVKASFGPALKLLVGINKILKLANFVLIFKVNTYLYIF